MRFTNLLILITCFTFLFFSCEKKEKELFEDKLFIPETYDFQNVNYSGQTQRLGMLNELAIYMKSANAANTTLDLDRMMAMYTNDSTLAEWVGNYESSKQLRGKTFEPVQEIFDELLQDLAVASASTEVGSKGVSGVVSSLDGAKNYLLNENGIELAQLIEKGLMGAVLYYQSTGVYFSNEKMNVDNETIIQGEGTAMEHHWDEAFGYLGVPTDFPSNLDGLVFWGKYSNDRNAILGTNQPLMDAFLKGRAAISENRITLRDEAIEEAGQAWELVVVGTAIHYLNKGIEDFDDIALRGHNLSEALGFTYSILFNPTRRISNTQIEELLELLGGDTDIRDANIYDADISNLQSAINKLADWYDLEDKKNEL